MEESIAVHNLVKRGNGMRIGLGGELYVRGPGVG